MSYVFNIKENTPISKSKYRYIKGSYLRIKFQDFLFRDINPQYEIQLIDEIWGLNQILNIPMSEIYNMGIQERRYFIIKHNEKIEEERRMMKGKTTMNSNSMKNVKEMTENAKR